MVAAASVEWHLKAALVQLLIVLVISLILGKNPLSLLQEIQTQSGPATSEQTTNYQPTPEEEELGQFVRVVLADTEDVWNSLLEDYREPTLVMFTGGVQSGCGVASSATGPFYCSEDEKVYIDLSFYRGIEESF